MNRRLKAALASILAVAAIGAVAPAANAYVYWANFGSGSVGRANLDGTNVKSNFISGLSSVLDVAIGSNRIYWREATGIGRANLDGTGVSSGFMTGLNNASKIAVYGDYIYWINGNGNSIGRANLDGTSPDNTFISGLIAADDQAYDLDIDSTGIYVTSFNNNRILKWNLAGTGRTYLYDTYPTTGPVGIAVRNPYLYTANFDSNSIGRGEWTGSSWTKNFVTGATGPDGMAVDSSYIYWSNSALNTIARANLDGTGASESFITALSIPTGMTVDSLSPAGSIDPSSNDYGNVKAQGGSKLATFTLTSSGNVPLTIEGSSISADEGGDFGILDDSSCLTGSVSLANGESCTVVVNFAPNSVGDKAASIILGTNAGAKSIALSGVGIAQPTIALAGRATKSSLKVRVGCGSSSACTIGLTGSKVGTRAAIAPKTVSIGSGGQPVVRLSYSPALKRSLARGGRVSVTATNAAGGLAKSIVVRVAK